MTTVIETSNGWAMVRERDRHVLADGFRTNSAAWRWIDCQDGETISRAEHVARPARLASCPASRPTDAEREGRAKTFATETPRGGWPSTTSRQRRVRRADGQGRMWRKCDRTSRPRQGSSMTGERTQGKAPSGPSRPTEPDRTRLYPQSFMSSNSPVQLYHTRKRGISKT